MQESRDNEKKKKGCPRFYSQPRQHSAMVGDTRADSGMCAGDTCSIRPSSMSSKPTTYFSPKSPMQHEKSFLEEYLPPDYLDAILNAARQGMLFALLCTLTEEFVTEQLKARHFSKNQIYWVNQIIRSLYVLAATQSIGKAVAAPMMNFILTKAVGLKLETANHVTTATLFATDVIVNPFELIKKGFSLSSEGMLSSPRTMLKKGVTFAAGFAGSVISSEYARSSYKNLRRCFFSIKNKFCDGDQMTEAASVSPKATR